MLGVQTAIANKIVASKGVYILALKANQDDLFQQVMNHVDEHISDDFAGVRSQRPAEDTKNGHGRSNLRTYPQLAVATRMNPAEFNPTDAEKRALMMSIAERGKFGLSPDDCIEVVEYLTHNAKKSGKPMDTRLLDTALNNRKQYDNKESETHWRDMVQSVIDGIIIEPKIKPRTRQARLVDERDIARQVYNSFPDDRDARRKEWERMTGAKSERALYRRASELGLDAPPKYLSLDDFTEDQATEQPI